MITHPNPKPYVNSFFHIGFNIIQLHFSKMLKLRKLWSKMYQFTFSETMYRVDTDKFRSMKLTNFNNAVFSYYFVGG